MTSRLIGLGPFDLPSSPSKDQSGELQVMDRSATRIPSSHITGHHPWRTGSPIGGVLPFYRGAVGVFCSPNRQGEALSGATTPGPEWTWERWQWRVTPHSPKLQHCWNLTIRLFSVIFRTLVRGGGLTPLQRCSQCILQPQLTGQYTDLNVRQFYFR